MSTPKPIQLGEPITPKLIRRYQGRREIAPLYLADPREAAVETHACEEAARAGLRSVCIGAFSDTEARTYVRFGSEWYSLNFDSYPA